MHDALTAERKTLWLARFLFQVLISCMGFSLLSHFKSAQFYLNFSRTGLDPRWVEYSCIVLLIVVFLSITLATIAAWHYTKYASSTHKL